MITARVASPDSANGASCVRSYRFISMDWPYRERAASKAGLDAVVNRCRSRVWLRHALRSLPIRSVPRAVVAQNVQTTQAPVHIWTAASCAPTAVPTDWTGQDGKNAVGSN